MKTLEAFPLVMEKLTILGKTNPDILAIILCGSYARGEQDDDSDIDIMIVTEDKGKWLENDGWTAEILRADSITREKWGIVETFRCFAGETELEINIAPAEWIALSEDKGTRQVLESGYSIIYDKGNYIL